MDTIAENETVVTKPYFCEAMAALNGYRKAAWKGVGILAALWLVLAGYIVLTGHPFALALIELAVVAAVGFWLLVLLPRGRYRRSFDAMEQRYGGDLARRIRFYPDHLELETCADTTEFPYDRIREAKTTRNLLVIKTEDKTGILCSLAGFTKGSAEAVLEQISRSAAQ